MHISTVTLSLAFFFACVGYNNAYVDFNDYTTPLCCIGDDVSMQCHSTTSPPAWWSAGPDCNNYFISHVACKDGVLAGYSRNQDGSASWVDGSTLEHRFGPVTQCYQQSNQCYNGELRCPVRSCDNGFSANFMQKDSAKTKDRVLSGAKGKTGTKQPTTAAVPRK